MRKQGSESRDQGSALPIVESRLCRGCDKPSGDADYCPECVHEATEADIEELERMYAGRPARRVNAVRAFRKIGRRAAKWLWVPNLVFIAGVLVYLGAVYGYALLDWLGWF
jgi:hypothetical protein